MRLLLNRFLRKFNTKSDAFLIGHFWDSIQFRLSKYIYLHQKGIHFPCGLSPRIAERLDIDAYVAARLNSACFWPVNWPSVCKELWLTPCPKSRSERSSELTHKWWEKRYDLVCMDNIVYHLSASQSAWQSNAHYITCLLHMLIRFDYDTWSTQWGNGADDTMWYRLRCRLV